MEIYIASFAGLLSSLLLTIVYLADRYEREPIDLIQNFFLSGLLFQLVLILAVNALGGAGPWSGAWLLVTVGCAAIYLPYQLRKQAEMDERFDGIVYSVAFLGGATCVIHLQNLPGVVAASQYRDALASGVAPDLRDLLILITSPGLSAELGHGCVVILAAVFVGAVIGAFQLGGRTLLQTVVVSVVTGGAVLGIDLATGGSWTIRGVMAVAAFGVVLAFKRRSVFKDRPQPLERDVLVLAVKTVLVVFGAALLATVLLQTIAEDPVGPGLLGDGAHAVQTRGPDPTP
ncbi:MAG: hypothetical protein QNL88_10885 [Acidobacteriota bacterium]|nr:hypothetical protein [Acidobacteriota bacterium]